MSDINGNNPDITFTTGLSTDTVQNLTDTAHITLTENTIDLQATNVLVNGEPIGLPTVLPHNLDLGTYDITGPLGLSLTGINTKTQNITSDILDQTNIIGKLIVDNINTNYVSSTTGDCTVNMFDNIIDITGTGLNFNSNPVISTPYSGEIEGASFKKTGGNSQQYLMADGSILTQSATSSNSNYYLYNSVISQTTTPASGNISYNNTVQDNATIIYISHLSRDNIDIEIFMKQLTVLSDVYIQDQNVSENYIQYNINGVPTLTVGSNVAIPVLKRVSSGTGSTNFPSGHQVILAFFTNSLEVDTRLSNLENTTALLTNNGTYTGFSGANGITANKIVVSGKTSDDILLGNGSTTSLTTQTDRIAVVEQKTGNQTVTTLNTTFAGVNGITANKFVVSGKTSDDILLGNGSTTSLTTQTDRISTLETKTVNQTAINGVSTIFTGTNGVISTKFSKPTGGNPLHFWMTDGTTNSNTYALNSDLINTNSNITTLQSKTQNLTATTTTNTFTGTGGIISDKFVTNLGTSLGFVKGDGSLDTTGYTTLSTTNALVNLVNPLIVKTQNQTATTLSTTFTGTSGIIADKFVRTTGGLSTNFWKTDGSVDTTPYIPSTGLNSNLLLADGSTTNVSRITNLEINTQYQSIVGLITSFTNGLRINGPVVLNGASILDIASIDRPYFGLQYQHNSTGVPTVMSSSLISAFGSTALSAGTWVRTNNYTRQYGCGLWTTGALADGAPCGYGGTVGTGAFVTTDGPFGLSYSLAIADSAYNANNCQNFFGLWNLQTCIPLTQATQLSVQRNMICFGSNTSDANICIYTAGPSTTVKQVDLGSYFPSNIEASGALTNFYKLCLYWDGTTIYYRADNTSLPASTVGAHVTGQFTPLSSQLPIGVSCTNQCVRIMGTPQSNGQAKLKVQRFGVF